MNYSQRLVIAFAVALGWSSGEVSAAASDAGESGLFARPGQAVFEENCGRWPELGPYVARSTSIGSVVVDRDGFTIIPHTSAEGSPITFRVVDASPTVTVDGRSPFATRVHSFVGRDRSRWVSDVATFGEVVIDGVRPGIDIRLRVEADTLTCVLELETPADLTELVFEVLGSSDLHVDVDSSSLIVATTFEEAIRVRPAASSPGHRVAVEPFACAGNRFGFRAPSTPPTDALEITTGIVFSVLLVSGGPTAIESLAIDDADLSTVAVGTVYPILGFPTSPGAFDPVGHVTGTDGFVSRVSADGTELIWSTYIGGSANDVLTDVAVLPLGDVVVAGHTGSVDLPVAPTAFDVIGDGVKGDAFVARLGADGSSLVWASYFGGSARDVATGLAVSDDGRIAITIQTESDDLPTTAGAIGPSLIGSVAGAIAVLTENTLNALSYVVTSDGFAVPNDASFAADGDLVLAGITSAPSLSCASLSFGPTPGGLLDGFVARLAPDLSECRWMSFIASAAYESVNACAVSPDGAVVVAGEVDPGDFPLTSGAFDTDFNGTTEGFVAKVSGDGTTLQWATLVGGADHETFFDVAVDEQGRVAVVGYSTSGSTYPTTPTGLENPTSTGRPVLTVLDIDGTEALFSTFVGSSLGLTWANSVCFDATGNVTIGGGSGLDPGFPVTSPAFGGRTQLSDGFLVRFDLGDPWTNLGAALGGVTMAPPALVGFGSLVPGAPGALTLDAEAGLAGHAVQVITGLDAISLPTKGGVLIPSPTLVVTVPLDATGHATLAWNSWPSGLPAGTALFFQGWIASADGIHGFVATNALEATQP